MASTPQDTVLLIVDGESALAAATRRTLAERNWRIVDVSPAAAAVVALREHPALLLYASPQGTSPGCARDPIAELARFRAAGGSAANVPVALLANVAAASSEPRGATGFDAVVGTAWPPERQADAIDRWRPEGVALALTRLEAAFGVAEIHALLRRFRVSLVEALARLDQDDALEHAHRLAGMAGTLGFAALGRAWLAVSEGRAPDREAIYRHTRIAITAIDTAVASVRA